MTTPLFPDVPPSEGFSFSLSYYTFEAGPYPSGAILSRAARAFPLYSCDWRINSQLPWSTYETVFDHFMTMQGRLGRFDFIDPNGWDMSPVGIRWPKLYAGLCTGDNSSAAARTFTMPMKSSTSYTLYRAGSALATPGDYSISVGTGDNGRDQIVFVAGHQGSAGQVLEWQATGRAVFLCKFVDDVMSFNAFCAMLATTGLKIQQVS